MSKDTLDNLFGSRLRVKILKFLFRNYPNDFNVSELSRRIQEPRKKVQKEISVLINADLVNKK